MNPQSVWRSVCVRLDVRVDVSNELTGSCLSTFVRLCAPLLLLFVDDGRSANSSARLV